MTRSLARGLAVAMATAVGALVAVSSAHAGTGDATASGRKAALTGTIGIQTQRYDARIRITRDAHASLSGNVLMIRGRLPVDLSAGGRPVQATADVDLVLALADRSTSSARVVEGSIEAKVVAPEQFRNITLAERMLPAGQLSYQDTPEPKLVGWLTPAGSIPLVAIELSGDDLSPERQDARRRRDPTPPTVRNLRTSDADIDLGDPDDPFIVNFAVDEPGQALVTVSQDGDLHTHMRAIRRAGRVRIPLHRLLSELDDLDPGRVTVRVVAIDRSGNRSRPRTIRIPVSAAGVQTGADGPANPGRRLSLEGTIAIVTQRHTASVSVGDDADVRIRGNVLTISGRMPMTLTTRAGQVVQATGDVAFVLGLVDDDTPGTVRSPTGWVRVELVAPQQYARMRLAERGWRDATLTFEEGQEPRLAGQVTPPRSSPAVSIDLAGEDLLVKQYRWPGDRKPPTVRRVWTTGPRPGVKPDDPFILNLAVNEPGHAYVTVAQDDEQHTQVQTIRRAGRVRIRLDRLLRRIENLDPGRVTVRVVAVDRSGNRSRARTIHIPVR